MKSEYFKIGALVDIVTPASTRAEAKMTILEVHEQGIVATQKSSKNAPVIFFSWEKIVELRMHQDIAQIGTRTTSGKIA